jgi:hypothetical protein
LRKRNTRLLQQADSMELESMRALRPLKNRPATMTSTAPSEAS